MASNEKTPELPSPSPSLPASSSQSDFWELRFFIPTLLAGIAGGGAGLVSKYRKVHGLANISAAYTANFAIVTGCCSGAHEFLWLSRGTGSDYLMNSAVGGFGSGAILGHLQGGRAGAIRYSYHVCCCGNIGGFCHYETKTCVEELQWVHAKEDWLKFPEWLPIQVLDE